MKANEFKMKLEQESKSLQNLQMVLEQFQSAKERDISEAVHSIKKMYEDASKAAQEWEERAMKAEAELGSVRKDSPRRMSLEKDYEAKEILIGKLRHDVIKLQAHLSEAMKKMRSSSGDENVDRYKD
jgi:capsule polysaccharide export protein KpsE/RkpR